MKRIVLILLTGMTVFCVGGVVAYYNTASFGYGTANLITFKENAVRVLDFEIEYRQIRDAVDAMEKYLPDKIITI